MKEDQRQLDFEETAVGEVRGDAGEEILTVSQVNRLARKRLEGITVTVQGEVSKPATGYAYFVYFDLRDSEAALPAILTRQQYKALDFKLEDGASVVARGTLTVYERQGKYQIRITEIRPFGEGELRRRIEALKRKLHGEGIFDDDRKKPLPGFPERIGLVTSPRGAAIRDVIVTVTRRFPCATIYVKGVTVQGVNAVSQICAGLGFFDVEWPVDLVILARGGGSLQDLEPFNTEEVARAMARMKVPVITGIGHEPDVTIADLVADRRASTPTGAAEAAVPDRVEVAALLAKTRSALAKRAGGELRAGGVALLGWKSRPLYRDPGYLLSEFMHRWERAAARLPGSPQRGMVRSAHRLENISRRPVYRRMDQLTEAAGRRLDAGRVAHIKGMLVMLRHLTGTLEKSAARLKALSPLAVLERGYSITINEDTGAVVRAPDEVEAGTGLLIRLRRGKIEAQVTGRSEDGRG